MNIVDAIQSKQEILKRKLSNGLTEVKKFWINGQIYSHYFEDEHSKRHGEFKWWWKDGTLGTYCHYKNGKLHGEIKWWYSTGTLRIHCLYSNGKKIKDYLKEV